MQVIAYNEELKEHKSNLPVLEQALDLIERLVAGRLMEVRMLDRNGKCVLQAGNLPTAGGYMTAFWDVNFLGQCSSGTYIGTVGKDKLTMMWLERVEKRGGAFLEECRFVKV